MSKRSGGDVLIVGPPWGVCIIVYVVFVLSTRHRVSYDTTSVMATFIIYRIKSNNAKGPLYVWVYNPRGKSTENINFPDASRVRSYAKRNALCRRVRRGRVGEWFETDDCVMRVAQNGNDQVARKYEKKKPKNKLNWDDGIVRRLGRLGTGRFLAFAVNPVNAFARRDYATLHVVLMGYKDSVCIKLIRVSRESS